jgi:hypothetical protein
LLAKTTWLTIFKLALQRYLCDRQPQHFTRRPFVVVTSGELGGYFENASFFGGTVPHSGHRSGVARRS